MKQILEIVDHSNIFLCGEEEGKEGGQIFLKQSFREEQETSVTQKI